MVKPVRNMILVSKRDSEEKTASGLYMVVAEEKVSTGTVIAVGSGHLTSGGVTVPLEIKTGDVVAFNKNMATEITVEGQKLLLMREDQVYCVL